MPHVGGLLVLKCTKKTVRGWLRKDGTTHACDKCDKVIDLGQWFVTKRNYRMYVTGRTHVSCLTDYCPVLDDIMEFVAKQEAEL